jgi:hypothetical protein
MDIYLLILLKHIIYNAVIRKQLFPGIIIRDNLTDSYP